MDKLKRKIKNKGLKITWIADQLKISQPSLSMYLSGKREMPSHIKLSLENLLK